MINKGNTERDCLWCSEDEDWAYVLQYSRVHHLKQPFITKLLIKLLKTKAQGINEEYCMDIVEDIKKFLHKRNKMQTNQ